MKTLQEIRNQYHIERGDEWQDVDGNFRNKLKDSEWEIIAERYAKQSKEEHPDGLFGKYHIERTDGTPINPKNQYFVLKVEGEGDWNHIAACRKAVVVYANEIYRELPELANDLLKRYDF